MEFGINFFPVFSSRRKSAANYFAESLELAEVADRLGYAHIRTVEHYDADYGGSSPNPIVFLAAASQRTFRARLIIGCAVPALGHPIRLASEVRMLDAISNGRVELGLARGFLPHEYDLFGINLDDSDAMFSEACRQIQLLLSKRRATDNGKFHAFRDVAISPRGVQRPLPPLWIAAVASRRSFVRAGTLGFDLMTVPHATDALRDLITMYREARSAAGHRGRGRVMIAFHLVTAPTDAEALRIARGPLTFYSAAMCRAMSAWRTRTSAAYAGYREVLSMLEHDSADNQIRRGAAWVGSVSTVLERVEAYREDVGGFDVASLQVSFGTISQRAARRSVELFAKQVMPKLAV